MPEVFKKVMKMELFTKRCVIRNFRPEDSEDLYNVLSDAEVMKYIKWLDVFLYPNKYIKFNYGAFHDKKSDS